MFKKNFWTRLLSLILVLVFFAQELPMIVNAEENVTVTSDSVSNDANVATEHEKAFILSEITGERDAFTKRFRMSDGTIQAARYSSPVHFLDSSGKWVDYDNTLTETVSNEKENGEFKEELKNKNADFDIRFSKKTNGKNLVSIEKDGHMLAWNYEGTEKQTAQTEQAKADTDKTSLEKVSSEVLYLDIFNHVDLQYVLGTDKVKENLILKNKDAWTKFLINYQIGDLTVAQSDKKSIDLCGQDGKAVFSISAPYMTDAVGTASSDVSLEILNQKDGVLLVRLTINSDWLNMPERAYPVVVDPMIIVKQVWDDASAACESAYIASSTPSAQYGRGGNSYEGSVYVGKEPGRGKTRALLKINNLPALDTGDKVVYAELAMYANACYPQVRVDVHRATTAWNQSTVCWNSNITYDPIIKEYRPISTVTNTDPVSEHHWQKFEITDMVRGWYSGDTNNGVLLRSDAENSTDSLNRAWFFSTDYPTYPTVRPIFLIYYRNMSGYEDYWSYTSADAGRSGTASVNNYNGNLIFSQPLTQETGGNRMPVSLSYVFNSNFTDYQNYSMIGYGGQTNFHIYIRNNPNLTSGSSDEEKKYKYYLNDADGTDHYFYFANLTDTTAKDEDGLGYNISVNNAVAETDMYGIRYTITDKKSNKMYFNGYGNLLKIEDTNGNSATVQYITQTGGTIQRISSVRDGVGRQYTFAYFSDGDSHIKSITDPAGRETAFAYNAGRLTWITFPDSKVFELVYTDYKLTRINSIDGNYVDIGYDSSQQKRVSNITCRNSTDISESYGFQYKQNETTITDLANRSYTYQFNNFGQSTGLISNTTGQAQFMSYNPGNNTGSTANKLLSESKVQTSATNNYINPTFSRDIASSNSIYSEAASGTYDIMRDTVNGHFSLGSLEVYKSSSAVGRVYSIQQFYLSAGTYTLSGYVHTGGGYVSNEGVTMAIEVWGANGIEDCVGIETVNRTTEWKRYSATVTVADGMTLKVTLGLSANAIGTAWFDDIQLEKSASESSFNLIENSGFTNSMNCWVSTGATAAVTLGYNELPGFTKAAYIDAPVEANLRRNVQIINVSGNQGDIFSYGTWIRASSSPINNGTKTNCAYQPEYNILLELYNSVGACVGTSKIDFNANVDSWQFNAAKVIANGNYSQAVVYVQYNHNVNSVFYTGTYCYKEEFGQSYIYDANGNIISAADLANNQSTFEYNGSSNELIKAANPQGGKFQYTYNAANTHQLESAYGAGSSYRLFYDNYANPLAVRIESMEIISGNYYYIRTAFNNQAVDVSGGVDTQGANVQQYTYNGSNAQKWRIDSVGTGRYTLTPACSTTNKVLEVAGGGNTNGTNVQIGSRVANAAYQEWKFEKNTDGTYRIQPCHIASFTHSLDIYGASSDSGANIQIWSNHNGENQKLVIEPVGTADNSPSITSTATYNSSGNYISSVTDTKGNSSSFDYNTVKGTVNSVTNAKGNSTSYSYDANTNALTNVSSTASGQTYSNSYEYTNDRLTKIKTYLDRTVYNFGYNSVGENTTVNVGTQNLITNTFDIQRGLLTQATFGNGHTINNLYDMQDRLIEKKYNNLSAFKYLYNNEGNLGKMQDLVNSVNYSYTYDQSGRLTRWKGSNNFSVDYQYNKNNIDKISYTFNGTAKFTNYVFSVDNIVTSLTWDVTDANNNKKLANTYDGLNRLTNKTVSKTVSGVQTNLLATGYSYNNGQNIHRTMYYAAETSGRVVSGDYNADGKTDIAAIYNYGSNQVRIHVWLSTGTEYSYQGDEGWYNSGVGNYDAAMVTNRVVSGDYNGDGKDDIAALYDCGSGRTKIHVWLSNGSSFTLNNGLNGWWDSTGYYSSLTTGRVVSGDFNGDGKYDIAAMYDYGSWQTKVHIWLSTGTAFTYQGNQGWYDSGVWGYDPSKVTGRVVAGDFTGDGKADLATMYDFGNSRCQIHLFKTNSNGTGFVNNIWTSWYDSGVGNYTADLVSYRMVAGDFNGDNFSDIAAMYNYGTTGKIHMFANNGSGTGFVNCGAAWYNPNWGEYDANKVTNRFVSADINGDGFTDVMGLGDYGPSCTNVTSWQSTGSLFTCKNDLWNSLKNKVGTGNATTSQLKSLTNNSDAAINYTYDKNGNIETISEGAVQKAKYYYDEMNQLIREDNVYVNKTITYAYDTNGNISNKKEYAYTTGTLGTVIKTYSYVYGATWKDKLTSYDSKTITYDVIGNPLTYNGWTYTWQNGRQLASMSKTGTSISYKYNDSGIRTQKMVNGVAANYYTDGANVIYETKGSDTFYYTYDVGGNLISFNLNGSEYYYVRNGQNDIIGLLDNTGAKVANYVYDSWGKLISIKDAAGNVKTTDTTFVGYKNPYRYRGYRYDSETALYYLQSRYYDPVTCRFINADSQLNPGTGLTGMNLYAYCCNNPVLMVDNEGNRPVVGMDPSSETKEERAQAFGNHVVLSNNLPKTGEPGSSQTLPNADGTPKQKRWYGPDGNAERDRDYNHPGNMPFPHDHKWKNGERQPDHLPPDPSYNFSWEPMLGVGVVVICVVGITLVATDDITGIGVADDFLFGPLGAGVGKGLIMVFG